jgi:hypothetical protein
LILIFAVQLERLKPKKTADGKGELKQTAAPADASAAKPTASQPNVATPTNNKSKDPAEVICSQYDRLSDLHVCSTTITNLSPMYSLTLHLYFRLDGKAQAMKNGTTPTSRYDPSIPAYLTAAKINFISCA